MKRSIIFIAMVIMLLSHDLVLAEDIPKNNNVLYIIDKYVYRELMKEDVILVESENNFLSIDFENINEEILDTIGGYDTFYIFNDSNVNISLLSSLDNYGGQLNGDKQYELAIDIALEDTSKDIILVNEESMIDYFIATQLNIAENRNILLIDEDLDVLTYLNEYGKDKNILFIESQQVIPTNIKERIMGVTKEDRYVIEEFNVTQKYENYTNNMINYKARKINNKLNITSMNIINNHKENIDKLLYDKRKVITIDNTDKFIDLIKNDYSKFNYNGDENNKYTLRLTYAKPINIFVDVGYAKNFIVPKEITEDLLNSVMEGDYGNGEVRTQRLTQVGYNPDEVENAIEKLITQREIEYAELLTQEANLRQDSYVPIRTAGSVSMYVDFDVNDFLKELVKMQGWKYSQPRRWEHGFVDCSSLVLRALINSGITKDTTNLTTWTISTDPRFDEVSMDDIKPGDILWYSGHVEVYMGGNITFGAFRPSKPTGYATNINRFNRAFRINGN